MTAFATLLIGPCARQSSRKSADSLVHRPGGVIFWSARCVGGGRYLERIKADRHAAKLGVFRTRADPQDTSLRYLADLPLCAPEQPKVSKQFGNTDLV